MLRQTNDVPTPALRRRAPPNLTPKRPKLFASFPSPFGSLRSVRVYTWRISMPNAPSLGPFVQVRTSVARRSSTCNRLLVTFGQMNRTRQLLSLSLLLGAAAWGQSEKSRIVGTVVDVTGAVIQGAKILAKDSRTGQQSQATSDEKGLYVINNLTPSSYDLTADRPGLSTAQYTEVRVTVGQERTLNIILQPPTVSTEVTVSG